MKWPFIRRKTHEWLLASALLDSARNNAAALAFAESKVKHAVVRAEAAEAQLANLVAPALSVVERCARLTTAEICAPNDPSQVRRVVAVIDLPASSLRPFYGAAGVLGMCVHRLVMGVMHLTAHEAAEKKEQQQ